MTTDDELDRLLHEYLEPGPAELSDRVLWAARAQLGSTRRRRAWFASSAPWRDVHMTQSTRLLLAGGGVLALVVAVGAGIFGRPATGPAASGPPASSSASLPPPSSSPSPVTTPNASAFAIPVYGATPVTHLAAAWATAGGVATLFGPPEVGPDGRIWVASSADNAFRILTPNGKLSETWGSPGSGNGQFSFSVNGENAGAIAFAPDGGFWVADTGNFRVQRFDKDRKFLAAWGRFGSADGEFAFPSDISVDSVGDVFVADDHRHVMQVFTSDGTWVRSVAAGHAGSFLTAVGEGYVDTSLLPDGRPGLTEYKPDGTIQGGIDMPDLMPNPLGMTRDAQGDLFIVGLDTSDAASTLVRFLARGGVGGVWDAGGIAVAVTPAGDAAYVLQPDDATIRKYAIPAS
ncbi:MAG TPA: NHL repeat-containing protein [Candidatus Limnocylindrales bacterium]